VPTSDIAVKMEVRNSYCCQALFTLGKQLITDVARGGCQTNAARLAPRRFVDLFLVSDGETARCIFRDEYGIAHLAARPAVLGLDLLPELQSAQFELWEFLSDFPSQTILIGFARALSSSRKHPKPVTSSSD
jgi:hypothetical protein